MDVDAIVGIGDIVSETAGHRAEPVGDAAVDVAPHDVVAVVSVIVADTDDLPVRADAGVEVGGIRPRATVGRAQPIGQNSLPAVSSN